MTVQPQLSPWISVGDCLTLSKHDSDDKKANALVARLRGRLTDVAVSDRSLGCHQKLTSQVPRQSVGPVARVLI
jgi:hypothetical protein